MSHRKENTTIKEWTNFDDVDILEGSTSELNEVYEMYIKDFPVNERKTYDDIQELMKDGKYKLLIMKHRTFQEPLGYAFIYVMPCIQTLWLDYVAIHRAYRGRGYGSSFFNSIMQYGSDKILGMFMEVEMANAKDERIKKTQLKRIEFYERLGAKRLELNYILPTADGGFPMHLYFKPSHSIKVVPDFALKQSIASVYEYIHRDIPNKEKNLKIIMQSIQDQKLKNDKNC